MPGFWLNSSLSTADWQHKADEGWLELSLGGFIYDLNILRLALFLNVSHF
jgi:hypothetical protein